MKFRPFLPTLIALAMCASPFAALAQKVPSPPAPAPVAADRPAKIAIVNPAKVFSEMQETKALRDKLEARRKELLNKEVEQRQAIEGLINQRAQFKPDHPKYIEMSEQIDLQKGQLQLWGLVTKASVDRDQKKMLKTLYDKIEVAVGEIAQDRNIDLVVADGRQELTNLEDVSPEELRRALNSRNILYSNKSVDITELVITILDKKFAQAGGAGAGAPAPLINPTGPK